MEHLRHFMISSTGSVLRAWIEFFDQDMDHRISKAEFSKGFVPRMARFSGAPPEVQTVALETESEWSPWLNGLRELGYKGDVFSLFSVLDDDDSNELTLDEVDVKQATIWRNFRLFVGSRFRSEEERRESAFAAAACRGGRGERGADESIRRIPMSAVPPLLAPPEGFEGAVAAGTAKANLTPEKIFCSSILGGAFIGYGAYLACTVGGACPGLLESNPGVQKMIFGAFGLPFGLFMTLLSGSELFTGNAAIVSMALLQGKVQAPHLAKSLLLSWLGNLVGAMLLARLAILAGTMPGGGAAVTLAKAKTSLSFETAFVRGLLCNWLVCMAVYLASMAKDATGKAVAIWLPISAFVTLGLEHSVANMFIIPAGIFAGAPVSWSTFFLKNLLPVTLGDVKGLSEDEGVKEGRNLSARPWKRSDGFHKVVWMVKKRCSDAADLEKGRRLREAKAARDGRNGRVPSERGGGSGVAASTGEQRSGEVKDQLSREDFCIGLRKCGWTWGVGDLNWVFDALQDQQQGILKVENLRWMGIELARKQKKQEAKARSKKWQALKRSQGISPQVKHRHFATFKAFLRKKFGNLIRAWRQALSQTDSMVLSKLHFLKAASRLGFAKESKELWKALDKDDSGSASIDELDPKNAELLAHFKAPNRKAARRKRPARQRNARARSGVKRVKRNVWVSQKFGGVRDTWRCRMNRSHTQMSAVKRDAFNAIDSDSTRFITATEFANGLKKFEFERPTKLFSHFDKDGDGKIAWTPSGGSANETMCFLRSSSSLAFARRDASHQIIDDVMFLENWTPLPFLVVAPNYKAKEEIRRLILVRTGQYMKAWRRLLDKDATNRASEMKQQRCNWYEFKEAYQVLGYTGTSACQVVCDQKKLRCASGEHERGGDIPGAWRAFDDDLPLSETGARSGYISLKEIDESSAMILSNFRKWAIMEFGSMRSLFSVFDEDCSGSLSWQEFRYACNAYSYDGSIRSLFNALDVDQTGSLTLKEVVFLEDWDDPDEEQTNEIDSLWKELGEKRMDISANSKRNFEVFSTYRTIGQTLRGSEAGKRRKPHEAKLEGLREDHKLQKLQLKSVSLRGSIRQLKMRRVELEPDSKPAQSKEPFEWTMARSIGLIDHEAYEAYHFLVGILHCIELKTTYFAVVVDMCIVVDLKRAIFPEKMRLKDTYNKIHGMDIHGMGPSNP
ncbi:unnamed protein product [Durusdinium trenchii]|uniref:EF-hand domain-containing protein n=1 Tax=Durusdinium trenchii TaxID=1381693 RepID=A0ABP0S412_9DINO